MTEPIHSVSSSHATSLSQGIAFLDKRVQQCAEVLQHYAIDHHLQGLRKHNDDATLAEVLHRVPIGDVAILGATLRGSLIEVLTSSHSGQGVNWVRMAKLGWRHTPEQKYSNSQLGHITLVCAGKTPTRTNIYEVELHHDMENGGHVSFQVRRLGILLSGTGATSHSLEGLLADSHRGLLDHCIALCPQVGRDVEQAAGHDLRWIPLSSKSRELHEQHSLFLATGSPGSGRFKDSECGWEIELTKYPQLGWAIMGVQPAIIQRPKTADLEEAFQREIELLEQLSTANIAPKIIFKGQIATDKAMRHTIVSWRAAHDGWDACDPEFCSMYGRYLAATQLCKKVACLHEGIVADQPESLLANLTLEARSHGDIKPQNCVCRLVQDKHHPGLIPAELYLIDFDSSMSLPEWERLTAYFANTTSVAETDDLVNHLSQLTAIVTGTASFTSPELTELYGLTLTTIDLLQNSHESEEVGRHLQQIVGHMQQGPLLLQADAYSLGITLLWLVDVESAIDVGMALKHSGSISKDGVAHAWQGLLGSLKARDYQDDASYASKLLSAATALLTTAPQHRATARQALALLEADIS